MNITQTFKLTLLLLLAATNVTHANPGQSSESYTRAYGLVQPAADINVLRTHGVFNRLLQVTDLQVQSANLYVVNSQTQPWAIAMPDGGVILSKGAVDICYENATVAEGDARMAFVLGHELSHLTSNDFWHHEVWLSFASKNTGQDIQRIIDVLGKQAGVTDKAGRQEFLLNMRHKELVADERGFLYAAIAGYAVDSLLGEGQESFLSKWVDQTGSLDDPTHYSATERTSFLIERMGQLRDRAALFDAAMRLGNFGHYDEAIDLLETFRRDFPSKEVLNNIGYFHLRKAIASMPDVMAYRWWLPTVAEVSLPKSVKARALRAKVPESAVVELNEAYKFLGAAARSDTHYIAARLNLATTLYYLGDTHKARGTIDEILAIDPGNEKATAMLAPLTLAQFPNMDMTPIALQMLEPAALKDDAPPYLKYNLARLYKESDRDADASALVEQLADAKDIPPVYRRTVCSDILKREGCKENIELSYLETSVVNHIGSNQPVQPGDDISHPRVRKAMSNWLHQAYGNNARRIDLYRNDNGESVVAISGKVQIIVKRPTGMTADLLRTLGEPLSKQQTVSGEVWHYSDRFAVLTDGPFLRENWYASAFAQR